MSKDMYDERGFLKPEYTMTEAQRKAMNNNNNKGLILPDKFTALEQTTDKKISSKGNINIKLIEMKEDVFKNKISLKKFEEYYILIKSGILTGLVDDALTYALALSEAVVLPITTDKEEEKYYTYIKDLENIIAKKIRESMNDNGQKLIAELFIMLDRIKMYGLSLSEYCNYCKKLELAMRAKIEEIDYLECAKALQNAEVIPTKTYGEAIKLHNYQKKIAVLVTQLEQQKKGKARR